MTWDTFQIESKFKHVGLEKKSKRDYLEKIPGKQTTKATTHSTHILRVAE